MVSKELKRFNELKNKFTSFPTYKQLFAFHDKGIYDAIEFVYLNQKISNFIGTVGTFAELPPSVDAVISMFGVTPVVGDTLFVQSDEGHMGSPSSYIINTIENGLITYKYQYSINIDTNSFQLISNLVGDWDSGTLDNVHYPSAKLVKDTFDSFIAGGTTGQVLSKNSDNLNDFVWVDQSGNVFDILLFKDLSRDSINVKLTGDQTGIYTLHTSIPDHDVIEGVYNEPGKYTEFITSFSGVDYYQLSINDINDNVYHIWDYKYVSPSDVDVDGETIMWNDSGQLKAVSFQETYTE
jgi:hypothetical protein